MKKLFISIALLASATHFYAQTRYYEHDKVFQENGYTYQCDVIEGANFVTLYNKDQKFVYADQINRNTGKQTTDKDTRQKLIDDPNFVNPPKIVSIFNNAFTQEEKQRINKEGEHKLSFMLFIDPDTGKIVDVAFEFLSRDPFGTIPVAVYRKIETQLKEQIRFKITDAGKQLNFVFLGRSLAIE